MKYCLAEIQAKELGEPLCQNDYITCCASCPELKYGCVGCSKANDDECDRRVNDKTMFVELI